MEINSKWHKWQITDVGFYYDLNGNGNPYEDDEKLREDGNDPASPQPGEFSILRQQPDGNVLYILAHVSSPTVPPHDAKVTVWLRTSVSDPKGIKVTLHYSGACPQGDGYHFHKPFGQEIIMVDPPNPSIDDKQIQIHQSEDWTPEVTTYDHITTPPLTGNYLDSEAIEAGLSGHQKRGRARDDKGQWKMKTLTLATLLRFLQAAGVEKIKVFDPHSRKEHELPVKNQADILYYSGHGSSATGGLLSCLDKCPVLVFDIAPSVNWKEDLDYFIIAGCSVLKPDPTNGFAWGNATLKQGILKGLCGYHGLAPSDKGGASVRIAERFTQLMTTEQPNNYDGTGHRVLNAWLQANREKHSLGIAYNRDCYWIVKEKVIKVGDYEFGTGIYEIDGPHRW